jgi:hypothetical protein
MSSLHLVLCRGAIALGLVLAGVCGSHVGAALSTHDTPRRWSDKTLAAADVGRARAQFARKQAAAGFPQRTDARMRGRKAARLLVLR